MSTAKTARKQAPAADGAKDPEETVRQAHDDAAAARAAAQTDLQGRGTPLAEREADDDEPALPTDEMARRADAATRVLLGKLMPATAVRVSYTSAEEWLEELASDADLVEARIVRCFVREEPPGVGYGMSMVHVVAGYVARGQVYELVATAGTDWHAENEDDLRTRARRDELVRAIAVAADELGLSVRGGRFGSL